MDTPGRDKEMQVEQLVLPNGRRRAVPDVAHKTPLAGHMGKDRKSQRILKTFYWPILSIRKLLMTVEAASNARSQLNGEYRRYLSFHYLPLPSDSKIAMDVVGLLPMLDVGHL